MAEFARSYEMLRQVKHRKIACSGFTVRVQYNPGRSVSTFADVDARAVRERACFLCPQALPEGQAAILYRGEYLILCNPMPVFPAHVTIPHLRHRPQEIEDAFDSFLRLAADLGPRFLVLYNGPKCGASAPDHLHFQAAPSGMTPIEREAHTLERGAARDIRGVSLSRLRNVGRQVVLIEGPDAGGVEDVFHAVARAFRKALSIDEEPMMNLVGIRANSRYTLLLYPRAAHRPAAFFLEKAERIAVSPAVVEMAGCVVTPLEKDFERLDRTMVEGIYREVSLDAEVVETALGAVG